MSASDVEIQGLMEQIEALQAQVAGLRAEVAELNALQDDFDDLSAELDEGGARGAEPPMAVARRGGDGYPFGPQYPFGIAFGLYSCDVWIFAQDVYRDGTKLTAAEAGNNVSDGDWVYVRVARESDTAEYDFGSTVPADDDDYYYRGLHKFAKDSETGTVTWAEAGWLGGELTDAADEAQGDADLDTPTHQSIETRTVGEGDAAVDLLQLFGFYSPAAYDVPYSGAKPKVVFRDDAVTPRIAYGTIAALAKSIIDEFTAGDGIAIDVAALTISVEDGAGLPSGGSQYQVLQRDGDGDAVWDWLHYKVPAS